MSYSSGKSSLLTCREKRTTEARAEGKAFPEAADYSTIVVSEESLGPPRENVIGLVPWSDRRLRPAVIQGPSAVRVTAWLEGPF